MEVVAEGRGVKEEGERNEEGGESSPSKVWRGKRAHNLNKG